MDDDDFVPYSMRPEWAGFKPLHYDDGGKVVAIQYSEDFRETMAYFRAVLDSGEKSPRVLQLTADMIRFNSADYTAWKYRWDTLVALGTDLQLEYEFTRKVLEDNSKNYQLWNHRRKILHALGPPGAPAELQFTAEALEEDAKHYHAWAHRQVAVRVGGSWAEELQYVERMIEADFRNNSAWNQRFFLLEHEVLDLQSRGAVDLDALIARELAYAEQWIMLAPKNVSPWHYVLGLFTLPGCRPHHLGTCRAVHALCCSALQVSPSSPPALDSLAQYYRSITLRAAEAGQAEPAVRAAAACDAVLQAASLADPIRYGYYEFLRRPLDRLLGREGQRAGEEQGEPSASGTA